MSSIIHVYSNILIMSTTLKHGGEKYEVRLSMVIMRMFSECLYLSREGESSNYCINVLSRYFVIRQWILNRKSVQ